MDYSKYLVTLPDKKEGVFLTKNTLEVGISKQLLSKYV